MPQPRPFPWRCPTCGKDLVHMSTVPTYTIDVKHGEKLIPVTVENFETPVCQGCGEMLFTNSSDDQIQAKFNKIIAAQ